MLFAAPLLDGDLLRLVGVPNPMPVLGRAEASLQRTGLLEKDMQRPRQVRRIVSAFMGKWGLREFADDAALLSSELVTNAFVHADGESVDVRLCLTERYVCLEVRDSSPGAPRLQPADPFDEGGRGLFLVEAIADMWGTSVDGSSTWCLLCLPHGLPDETAPTRTS